MGDGKWTDDDVKLARRSMVVNANAAERYAEAYAGDAGDMEPFGKVDALRMRNAAHHFVEAAAWLRGDRYVDQFSSLRGGGMGDAIVGGDLTLGAKELRAEARRLGKAGDDVRAKRYREAAWRLDEAAAWLKGDRDEKGVANG